MKLFLTAATLAALLVAAWSWNPPDRVPGWLVEACAEGTWDCSGVG